MARRAIYRGECNQPYDGQTGTVENIDDGSELYEGARLFVPDDEAEREEVGGYIVGDSDLEYVGS